MDSHTANKKNLPKEHPSGDKRFKILDATMKRHQYQQDALIEVLHKAQELFGYLENDLLHYIAQSIAFIILVIICVKNEQEVDIIGRLCFAHTTRSLEGLTTVF